MNQILDTEYPPSLAGSPQATVRHDALTGDHYGQYANGPPVSGGGGWSGCWRFTGAVSEAGRLPRGENLKHWSLRVYCARVCGCMWANVCECERD